MTAVTLQEKNRLRKQRWREDNPGLLYHDDRPFVGVDGEGGTIVEGSHDYFLLRAGEEAIASPTGFTSWDCFYFLSGLNPRPIYVAYFFDYDVTMMCRDLEWAKIYRLVHRKLRYPTQSKRAHVFPVDVHGGEFQIDWLPRKFFKVRRRLGTPDTDGRSLYGPWITVNDVGTFFQCRFTDALERWNVGTGDQRTAIAAGKAHRASFDVRDLPDIGKYNHLECRLLSDLMTDFRTVCRRSGYVPRLWQGPGQIAEAMFRARGIPKRKKIPLLNDPANERLLEFAAGSFYGGRPEVVWLGPVPGPVTQYDINAAYPYAMLHLPCLLHGKWKHHAKGSNPYRGTGIHYGHFTRKGNTTPRLFGFPVRRDDGSIYYPAEGTGWYWSMEIQAASHQVFTPGESFTYTQRCDCEPFGFLRDLYQMRVRLGKEALGLYLKLAMNSLYGKMAQSVGSPQYANPIWASFITSFTRAQVQNMIHLDPEHRRGKCGRNVVMVATDAIFTRVPLPIPDSRELGAVSITEHPGGVFTVQPGLYFGSTGKPPKTRGVPQSAVAERLPEFIAAWKRMCETGKEEEGVVNVPVDVFIGLRQAVHRRKADLAGTWTEYREGDENPGKRIGFDYRTKRGFLLPPFPGTSGPAETFPYPGGPDAVTVPYSREIGRWRDELRLPFENQPDWASMLEAPDE